MPLYEYQCQSCGKRVEILQRMSDPPSTTCALCGGPQKRLVSAPSVQFKGTGWYVTDYAKKSGGAGKTSEGASAGDDSSASSVEKKESGGEAKGGEAKAATETKSEPKKESSPAPATSTPT
jgi:putative FmdB family regulatory protein